MHVILRGSLLAASHIYIADSTPVCTGSQIIVYDIGALRLLPRRQVSNITNITH